MPHHPVVLKSHHPKTQPSTTISSVLGDISDVTRLRSLHHAFGLNRATSLKAAGSTWAMPLSLSEQQLLLNDALHQQSLLLLHHQHAAGQQTLSLQLKSLNHLNTSDQALVLGDHDCTLSISPDTLQQAWLVVRRYRGKLVNAIEWLDSQHHRCLSVVNLNATSSLFHLSWRQQLVSQRGRLADTHRHSSS